MISKAGAMELISSALGEPAGEEAAQLIQKLQDGGTPDDLHQTALALYLHACSGTKPDPVAAAMLLDRQASAMFDQAWNFESQLKWCL